LYIDGVTNSVRKREEADGMERVAWGVGRG